MCVQLLRGGAVGMLVEMLPYQPAAADLLCFMATQQQCKDAFLDSRVLAGLVDLLHTDPASGMINSPCSGYFYTDIQSLQ